MNCELVTKYTMQCLKRRGILLKQGVYLFLLRVPDCNFRESLAKLEKSKPLIICLKFTFGELSSKILFECSGNF